MKKQTIFFYLLLVLFGVNSYSQNNKIEYVHLRSTNSIFIGADVDISISTYKREKDYVDVSAQIGKKKFSTRITRNDYEDIWKAILEISSKDIMSIDKIGLDGTTICLMFKNSSNDISYCVWGLSKNDQETSLKDFLKATKLILKVVHVSGQLLEID